MHTHTRVATWVAIPIALFLMILPFLSIPPEPARGGGPEADAYYAAGDRYYDHSRRERDGAYLEASFALIDAHRDAANPALRLLVRDHRYLSDWGFLSSRLKRSGISRHEHLRGHLKGDLRKLTRNMREAQVGMGVGALLWLVMIGLARGVAPLGAIVFVTFLTWEVILIGAAIKGAPSYPLLLLPITIALGRMTWSSRAKQGRVDSKWMAARVRALASLDERGRRRALIKVAIGRVTFLTLAFFGLVVFVFAQNIALAASMGAFAFMLTAHLSKPRLAALQLASFPELADELGALDDV